MELLILLALLLINLLVGVNCIKNQNKVFKRARRILGSLAILVSFIGVVTPLNWIYGFCVAYILLFVVWIFNLRLKRNA